MRTKIDLTALATEKSNPRSKNLDKLSTLDVLKLINQEDASIPRSIAPILPLVARFIEEAAKRLRDGGRLFYVGAGTSGRLGVLDASECPPTFGTPPTLVQGIVAGGPQALVKAIEGAEDDASAGRASLLRKKLRSNDCVVGLSASGRTPFAEAALKLAKQKKALTAGITCNPTATMLRHCTFPLVANVGPEIIAGSTRLKCGTAQKLILNMISTGIMIRLGRVSGNRMVDLVPKSQKLWERAKLLVIEALDVSEKEAEKRLKAAKGNARKAINDSR